MSRTASLHISLEEIVTTGPLLTWQSWMHCIHRMVLSAAPEHTSVSGQHAAVVGSDVMFGACLCQLDPRENSWSR